MNKYFYRILLAAAIIFLIVLVAFFGLKANLSVETLTSGGGFLYELVQKNYALSLFIFILIVALFTTIFSPGIIFLTIAGGILFGFVPGALASNVGMTLGSALAFLSSRYLLHDLVKSLFGKRFEAFAKHIRKEGRSYLLFLRLSPVIPAFVINLFSGLTKIHLWTFIWTTSLGSLPADFIYAYLGNEIKDFKTFDQVFASEISMALLLLALFSLLPLWLRRRNV
jgi:uncharacterized membrane protein YdjX (TVP38/TMEM64 family)